MEITSSSEARAPQSAASDPLLVLDGLVSTLQSLESAIASLQALREYALALASQVAEAMNDDGPRPGFPAGGWESRSAEMAQRAVAADIATATRMNDRTVQRQMDQAVELLDRFPATFAALAQGRISLAHVRIIQDAGAVLEDAASRARFEHAVVACALTQAPSRLRRAAAREAEKASTTPLADRHQRAVQDRRVSVNPLPDGMAELAATLPAAVAYGIHDRLTHMAKTHAELAMAEHTASSQTAQAGASTGEPRSMDQLRADLLAELLLRGAPTGHDTPDGLLAAITARVDVNVPVLTLIDGPSAGAGEHHVPAELNGRHPIDPATARLLAGRATAWNRVLTDPVAGALLAVDRYRPGEDLKRLLRARDTRCRFPGCGIPARDLDLDHTHDAALGGATETGNLAGLCRRHHMLKHQSRWTVRQSGRGDLEWTSPTGRKYKDSPPTPATHTADAIAGVLADVAKRPAWNAGKAPDPPPF